MLKKRLIPKLQMMASRHSNSPRMVLVTTKQFDGYFEIGDPVSQAKIYEAQAADELIFVDIGATEESVSILSDVVKRAASEIFMPITVGGGVKTIDDFRTLLVSGADKVSINTAAVEDPDLIKRASNMFGAQCVVLSIDFRRDLSGEYHVWTRGGKEKTNLQPLAWAQEGERLGAGELLLTSIDRDGTRSGLDIELTKKVADHVSIPVIAAGGCGLAKHFMEGFIDGKADAVSAGTYFCFKDENPMQTRAQIRNAGIPIRLHK
jgi:cyclase